MGKLKEHQVNVRFTEETHRWLLEQVGGDPRKKAEFIRYLVDRTRAEARKAELRAMFDAAAEELTAEDREERVFWENLYSGRE